MIKRNYYAWFDGKYFWVSKYPADAPVRPSKPFESKAEVDALGMQKRAQIHWWPPLPDHLVNS